jgi:AGZA family xanthine/uracil permease-like MFS transporter
MKKQLISSDSSGTQSKRTSVKAEVFAGTSTAVLSFFAILGGASIIAKTIAQDASLFMTIAAMALIVSGLVTILASLYTRLPMIFTLSLGVNTLVASAIVNQLNLDWSIALGLLLLEGILFSLLVLSPFPLKFMRAMPEFFQYAWPACLGGIMVSVALISGKALSFRGSSDIALLNFKSPELFLFFLGTLASFILFKKKGFRFFALIPILMSLLVMIIPTLTGPNMNKGIIIAASFFVGWLLFYSVLFDAKKRSAFFISMSLVILGLILSIAFSDKIPDAIIPPPFKWFGDTGVFFLPSLSYLKEIIGYPMIAIGRVFSMFNLMWAPLLSILISHFLATWAMLSTLKEQRKEAFPSHAAQEVSEKRTLAVEGASSILGAHLCLGSGTLTLGSIFSHVLGSKTALSSIVAGSVMILSIFMLPFVHRYFSLYTVSPLLLMLGAWLIYHSAKHWFEHKEDLMPLLAVFITGTLSWNLYFAFFAGLLVYVINRIAKQKNKDIHPWVWASLCILFLFAFLLAPVSYLHFVAY